MKVIKVTCDTCQRDISTTGNCEEFCILLRDEPMPQADGCVAVTTMAPKRWIGDDRHFCSDKCLREWVEHFGVHKFQHKESGYYRG